MSISNIEDSNSKYANLYVNSLTANVVNYDHENITGTTDSTSTSTGALIVSGGVGVAKHIFSTNENIGNIGSNTGGITLINNISGYSPSLFNHYEDFSTTVNLSGTFSFNGAIVRLVRVGKQTTAYFTGVHDQVITAGGASTIAFSAGAIPARFAPSGDNIVFSCPVQGSITVANTNYVTGILKVNSDGSGSFYAGPSVGDSVFLGANGSNVAGYQSICVTWLN